MTTTTNPAARAASAIAGLVADGILTIVEDDDSVEAWDNAPATGQARSFGFADEIEPFTCDEPEDMGRLWERRAERTAADRGWI